MTLSNRHQLKQCWEFSPINVLGDLEKVPGRSVSTPLLSLPIDLQTALKVNLNLQRFRIGGQSNSACLQKDCKTTTVNDCKQQQLSVPYVSTHVAVLSMCFI